VGIAEQYKLHLEKLHTNAASLELIESGLSLVHPLTPS
jgi:hypothetical protein